LCLQMLRSEEEDVEVPFEGAHVAPTSRPLARELRRKARAQLSGSVRWAAVAQSTRGGAGEEHSTDAASPMGAEVRLCR
jgi:hypothetical protein